MTLGYVELGKYLTQERELRGLSREDVSRETKIPPSLLMALETGQAERLPSRVFVVNFLKAYAEVVGLDQDEVLLRYEEVAGSPEPEGPVTSPAEAERRRRLQRGAVLIVGGAAAVGAAIWFLRLSAG